MRLNSFLILAIILIMTVSCQTNTSNKPTENLAPNVHKINAKEVIQSTSYTYVLVSEAGKETWIATAKQEVEAGKTLRQTKWMEMFCSALYW